MTLEYTLASSINLAIESVMGAFEYRAVDCSRMVVLLRLGVALATPSTSCHQDTDSQSQGSEQTLPFGHKSNNTEYRSDLGHYLSFHHHPAITTGAATFRAKALPLNSWGWPQQCHLKKRNSTMKGFWEENLQFCVEIV
jgi:hypothetical protein